MKFAKKPYSPYVKAGSWRMQRQVHRMIAKLISLTPTILTAALAVIFVVAGIIERQRAIPPSAEADIGDAFGSTTTRVPRVTRL